MSRIEHVAARLRGDRRLSSDARATIFQAVVNAGRGLCVDGFLFSIRKKWLVFGEPTLVAYVVDPWDSRKLSLDALNEHDHAALMALVEKQGQEGAG